MNDGLTLILIASAEDPEYSNSGYQSGLQAFESGLEGAGLDPSAQMLMRKAVGFGSLYTGEFYLSAAKHLVTTGVPVIAAWLHGRSGRKVKLKVGDTEVEAATVKEVEQLLTTAQQFKDNNEPKRIHES